MPSSSRETLEALIKQARIMGFAAWEDTYPAEAIALFQAADDAGRYLSDADLQQLHWLSAESVATVQQLRDQADEIVNDARAMLLVAFPDISQPGGRLGTEARTQACWRDFWQYLRCITYGIAAQRVCYTSATGLHYPRLLYRELDVPLDAMVVGLEGLKAASLKRVAANPELLAPYFDHLIEKMSQF